jgi:hypothetical protein
LSRFKSIFVFYAKLNLQIYICINSERSEKILKAGSWNGTLKVRFGDPDSLGSSRCSSSGQMVGEKQKSPSDGQNRSKQDFGQEGSQIKELGQPGIASFSVVLSIYFLFSALTHSIKALQVPLRTVALQS